MKRGRLRERITFQRRSTKVNALGEQKDTWSDVVSVWAAVNPLTQREFLAAQQMQSDVTTRIECEYFNGLAGVTVQDRILHVRKAAHYDIRSVINAESRDRELQFMCTQHSIL